MYDCYCKNCKNNVGEWDNKYKWYDTIDKCYHIKSKNNNFVYFLDCISCNKFVGILCYNVCENCFKRNKIIGEKNLYKWFFEYKKIVPIAINHCEFCKEYYDFRCQFWFFKELTFHK